MCSAFGALSAFILHFWMFHSEKKNNNKQSPTHSVRKAGVQSCFKSFTRQHTLALAIWLQIIIKIIQRPNSPAHTDSAGYLSCFVILFLNKWFEPHWQLVPLKKTWKCINVREELYLHHIALLLSFKFQLSFTVDVQWECLSLSWNWLTAFVWISRHCNHAVNIF